MKAQNPHRSNFIINQYCRGAWGERPAAIKRGLNLQSFSNFAPANVLAIHLKKSENNSESSQ